MNYFKIHKHLLNLIPLKGAFRRGFRVSNYFTVILLLAFVALPKINFSKPSAFSPNLSNPISYTTFPNTAAIQFTHIGGKIKDTEPHFDVAISPFEIEEDEDSLQHKKHPTETGGPHCAYFSRSVNLNISGYVPTCTYNRTIKVLTGSELVISNRNFRI